MRELHPRGASACYSIMQMLPSLFLPPFFFSRPTVTPQMRSDQNNASVTASSLSPGALWGRVTIGCRAYEGPSEHTQYRALHVCCSSQPGSQVCLFQSPKEICSHLGGESWRNAIASKPFDAWWVEVLMGVNLWHRSSRSPSTILFHILHLAVCPCCHPCVDATMTEKILAMSRQSNITADAETLPIRHIPKHLLFDLTGKLFACETKNTKTQCHCPTTGILMTHAKNTHWDCTPEQSSHSGVPFSGPRNANWC